VVDVVGADDAVVVHDHRGAVGDAGVLLQHPERRADAVVRVGQHRVGDLLRERLAVGEPGLVAVERVGADPDDLDLVVLEVVEVLLEAPDLGGAHEREVQRVPVQYVPLPRVVLAADLLLLALVVGHARPLGLLASDHAHAGFILRNVLIFPILFLQFRCRRAADRFDGHLRWGPRDGPQTPIVRDAPAEPWRRSGMGWCRGGPRRPAVQMGAPRRPAVQMGAPRWPVVQMGAPRWPPNPPNVRNAPAEPWRCSGMVNVVRAASTQKLQCSGRSSGGGAALVLYRASGPRRRRPGRAPVCLPSRSSTSPPTTVAPMPRARCTRRRAPAGRSCTTSGSSGAIVSGSKT